MKFLYPVIILLLLSFSVHAQSGCTEKGQTPFTAFPVCGTNEFHQKTVPLCGNNAIPVPTCNSSLNSYTDVNPFWYTFTCFKSGTLGFSITPINATDDYDWQIFDITGHNPNDVYTNPNLFVSCNWSGASGLTGTSPTAAHLNECGSTNANHPPKFSSMPTLQEGHTYLLLVSNFSSSQKGYDLAFGGTNGGTAVITDTKQPLLQSVNTNCSGTQFFVKLNKKMLCNSLASNGSDFVLTPALATITNASGINCNNGFSMDSIVLTMSNPLPPGTYNIAMKNGTDLSTITDICGTPIPVGDNKNVVIDITLPANIESLKPVGCAPSTLELVFDKLIDCSSIAPDGSDFRLSGSLPINITGAKGICNNQGFTKNIILQLSQPIVKEGAYTITLQVGTDNNTLVNECNIHTLVNGHVSFTTADTVSAAFSNNIRLGCKIDTVELFHNGNNKVNSWKWTSYPPTQVSSTQNPVLYYTLYGNKSIELIVSNGTCKDTSSVELMLDNELKAQFESPAFVCPEDITAFRDLSIGNIVSWKWHLGDGDSSELQHPLPKKYNIPFRTHMSNVILAVQNNYGCFDTSIHPIKIISNCKTDVPSAFTPNGDGVNDYLYPLNIDNVAEFTFQIFSRMGKLVFSSNQPSQKWDGTFNGMPQPVGTYVWQLSYTDSNSQERFIKKGTTILIR